MNLVSKCQILRNRMHMLVQQIKLFLENGITHSFLTKQLIVY